MNATCLPDMLKPFVLLYYDPSIHPSYFWNSLTLAVISKIPLFCGNNAPFICNILELSFGFGRYRPICWFGLAELWSPGSDLDKLSMIPIIIDWTSSSRGRYNITRLPKLFVLN